MIGYVRGRIVEMNVEGIIVDVNGVGYELYCSVNTLDVCDVGEEARLQVHTHVREDAIALYGFATKLEKNLFLSLLKVNGIGPKLALKVLSSGPLANIIGMIEAGDVKGLSGLPKVGKKTAEQIILTLKGKLVGEETVPGLAELNRARPQPVRSEIVSALVNLGFRLQDVEKAITEMPADMGLEDGIRRGLQALTGPA